MLFVGRQGAVAGLSSWLSEEPKKGVRLGSIAGAGGMGKTFLLDYCLRHTSQFSQEDHLIIRLEGQRQLPNLIELFVSGWLRQLLSKQQEKTLKMPHLQRIEMAYLRIMEKLSRRIERQGDDALRPILTSLLRFGLQPHLALALRPFDVELAKLNESTLEASIRWLQEQPGMRAEWQLFFSAHSWRGRSLRNRLRRDLEGVLAEALLRDLQALFSSKHLPYKHLLLIFDDYESISPLVSGFLVEHFVPRLRQAPFSSFVLFLGRDPLLATHPEWGQHHRPALADRIIELRPFSREEADEMMRRRGLHSPEQRDALWKRTQGFPFLLDTECEDATSGGTSALGLKLFYQRLTRWMTPIQERWLLPLCFLDEINLETVAALLPAYDPSLILTWFKDEASLRDPHAARWQVIPFVRQRLLQYLRNDSPQQYAAWAQKAQAIQKEKEPSLPSLR